MAPARARSAEVEEPRTESTAGNGQTTGAEREAGRGGPTLNLPFVTAQFRKPELHLPGRREAGAATGAVAEKVRSLSPAELAYYAGLGVLAAVELIDWPVALAVGAGTALARSGRDRGERRREETGPGEAGPGEARSEEAGSGTAGSESRGATDTSS